jgi:hypothetical protein
MHAALAPGDIAKAIDFKAAIMGNYPCAWYFAEIVILNR